MDKNTIKSFATIAIVVVLAIVMINITLINKPEKANAQNATSCAPGTHYNPNLNRCMQDIPTTPPCPQGTHYSPGQNRCVQNIPPS